MVDVCVTVGVIKLEHLEVLAVVLADILRVHEAHQVGFEAVELSVLLVGIERQNWDPIVELPNETVGGVIHKNHSAERAVQYLEVLDEKAVLRNHAMVAIQSVVHELALRVQVIEDAVSVIGMRCREHDDFEIAGEFFQKLLRPWANVDPGFDLPLARVEGHYDVCVGGCAVGAVDERLIEVEDKRDLV